MILSYVALSLAAWLAGGDDWPAEAYQAGELDAATRERRQALLGPDLPLAARLPLADCCTVVAHDSLLYAGGERRVQVYDLTDPAQPRLLGRTEPFAHVRHLVRRGTHLFVASRAEGLFVVDVANPEAPHVVSWYDTMELATGLALSGDVLAICCRTFGVEFVDVSDPRHLRHLSYARTGEAQLVAIRDGFAYVGVWGTRELVVVDLRDARRPQVTAHCPVDGYADGVAVDGRFVYVATGHHARTKRPAAPGDPEWGRGHGLEVFRLDDPARPTWLGRVKTMPSYQRGPDCWVPKVAGDHVFLADGLGGLCVFDASDPAALRPVGQALLPFVARAGKHDYAHDVAVVKDYAVVAGAFGGLAVYHVPDVAVPERLEAGRPARVGEPAPLATPPGWRAWACDGQVWQADLLGDLALVAAGSAGLRLVKPWPAFQELPAPPVEGPVFDVRSRGGLVAVAEGRAGVSLWRGTADGLTLLGRYRTDGVARGVVPLPNQRLLVHVGDQRLEVVDTTDPAAPRRLLARSSEGRGLLYGDQIAGDLIAGRYGCVFWHVTPPLLFDLSVDPPQAAAELGPVPPGGVTGVADDGDGALAVSRGGLVRLAPGGTGEAEIRRDPQGLRIQGRCRRWGRLLLCWERHSGLVTLVDLRDPQQPKVLEQVTVPGHPGQPSIHSAGLVVPCGYQGLWVKDRGAPQNLW